MTKYSLKDLSMEQLDIAEAKGINISTLRTRLSMGWDIERAINEKVSSISERKQEGRMVQGNVSDTWYAGTNKGLKCPVDGCNHVGEVITKAHCRIVHNMEREEVAKIYGMPVIVESKGEIVSHNNGRSKWYSVDSGMGVL